MRREPFPNFRSARIVLPRQIEVHLPVKVPCCEVLRGMLVAAVIAAAVAVASPAAASPNVQPATCGQGSWVAGTVDICDGELVYRDYVYDDFGARPAVPGLTLPQIIDGLGFP